MARHGQTIPVQSSAQSRQTDLTRLDHIPVWLRPPGKLLTSFQEARAAESSSAKGCQQKSRMLETKQAVGSQSERALGTTHGRSLTGLSVELGSRNQPVLAVRGLGSSNRKGFRGVES